MIRSAVLRASTYSSSARISRLTIVLEGCEEATYRRGTSSTTDRHVFTTLPIADSERGDAIAEGRATVDLATLRRVLNSAVMHYYARLTSFQIEGGYQCYQKNFIARFAVPEGVAELAALRGEDFDRALCDRYGVPWEDVAALLSASP